MAPSIERIRGAFEAVDLVLAIGGVVGLVLFFMVLPREHPDRLARGHISRSDAIATARAYASESSGIPLQETKPQAEIHRNGPLLDSLQEAHGRREALDLAERDTIPAFHWQVRWGEPTEEEDEEEVGQVRLTLNGRPMGYRVDHAVLHKERAHHTGALQSLFGDEISADSLVADSLIYGRLAFRLESDHRRTPLAEQLSENQRIYLDSTDAVKLALYHLARSVFRMAKRPDSVRTASHDGVTTATVHFSSDQRTIGKWYSASVEVTPTGSLVRLDSRLVREGEEKEGMEAEEIFDLLMPLLYAFLSLLIVVLFFRRLTSRLVDTRMALRDGIVFGLAAGIAMSGSDFGDLPDESIVATIILVIMILLGSVGSGILAFFVSGGVSSVARDVWSEKLQSFDLLRKGAVRNIPVGLALVRGSLGGLTIVALFILALMVSPSGRMDVSSEAAFFTSRFPGIPFVLNFCGTLFFAFFLTFAVPLLISSLLKKRIRAGVVVAGVVLLLLTVLQISPLDLRPLWAELAVSAAFGALIAWLLWRFDAVSTLIAILVSMLIWSAASGLAVTSAPEMFDAILVLTSIFGIGVLGFIGVASGKTSSEVPVIVPEYIVELAQRERLNREFELAREVQLSFLPARTPDLPGLDIASICLPATEVGGDYYDFFSVDGQKLGIVVGDVSGKGMQAAFYMTLMKGILQTLVTQTHAPAAILTRANELFRMNASRGTFMSMIFGVLDPVDGRLQFARAGHNPAVICRASASRPEMLQPQGAAIGLAPDRLFEHSIEQLTLTLEKKDVLVIYTDGITEAMNIRRELYEEDRLLEVISQCRDKSAEQLLSSIISDVEDFTGYAPRHDDMTLMVIRKN